MGGGFNSYEDIQQALNALRPGTRGFFGYTHPVGGHIWNYIRTPGGYTLFGDGQRDDLWAPEPTRPVFPNFRFFVREQGSLPQ
jgi:hypothetical protein